MATEVLVKSYQGADLSGATNGVIYLPVSYDSTILAIKVKTDLNVAADAEFVLTNLDGTTIAGTALTIESGTKKAVLTGLEIARLEDADVLLKLVSGAVSSPVTLVLVVSDDTFEDLAFSLSGLTDVEIDDPQPGDALVYDDEDSVWRNQPAATTGGGLVLAGDSPLPLSEVWYGTQTDYEAISEKDAATLYIQKDAIGGGSGDDGDGVINPDTVPETPTIYDDEFTAGSLDAKWTAFNTPDSVTVANGQVLIGDDAQDADLKGIAQDISAISGGAWKFRAKVHAQGAVDGRMAVGVIVKETLAGKTYFHAVGRNTGTAYIGGQYGANNGAFSLPASASPVPMMIYLEVEYDSPNIICRYSFDGRNYFTLSTYDIDAQFTTGGIDYIGLGLYAYQNTGMNYAVCDWFRRIA